MLLSTFYPSCLFHFPTDVVTRFQWFVTNVNEQGAAAVEARCGRVRRTLIDFSIAR